MADEKAKTGIELIAAERERQITQEGWTPGHDDEHDGHELAMAAICYAACASRESVFISRGDSTRDVRFFDPWPWGNEWDKRPRVVPSFEQRKAMLVKAGALIAAEIDRLQRSAKAEGRDA